MLDPYDPRPPYLQVVEALTRAIRDGRYRPGSPLPPRAALLDKYGVANATLQKALDELKRRGLVVGRQGRGVFVVETPPVERDRLGELEARVEALERQVAELLQNRQR